MDKNEEKLIKNLNDRANDHTPILTPHPHFEDRFQVSYFYVRDHADLLLTARALVYLCMRTLDPDDGADREPDTNEIEYINQALSIANRLMPKGEESLLDHINLYYRGKHEQSDLE